MLLSALKFQLSILTGVWTDTYIKCFKFSFFEVLLTVSMVVAYRHTAALYQGVDREDEDKLTCVAAL